MSLIELQVGLLFLKDYFSIYVYICMSIHEFRCVCQVPRMSTCRSLCMNVSHMWYMCVPAYTYVLVRHIHVSTFRYQRVLDSLKWQLQKIVTQLT